MLVQLEKDLVGEPFEWDGSAPLEIAGDAAFLQSRFHPRIGDDPGVVGPLTAGALHPSHQLLRQLLTDKMDGINSIRLTASTPPLSPEIPLELFVISIQADG